MKRIFTLQWIILISLGLAGCTPINVADETPERAGSTPTLTAISSASPTPESIPTPALTPESNPDQESHILTAKQRERLVIASHQYLADTEAEALIIARQMDFVLRDGHPSNMCGPLAIAILKDAGLVNPYASLHDFWLLRPDKNPNTIAETFPPDQFELFRFTTPTDEFDFSAFPLQEGDFLYLYAGLNGTFEHMLTVTRVDEGGRAYTVTNINTNDGYLIREVLLYDPANPGVGQLYDWTNREINRWLGMTGFGGFDVWRIRKPVSDPSLEQLELSATIDEILAANGGEWHILIRDSQGETIYSRNAYRRLHAASVIKIPVALLFFSALENNPTRPENLTEYLSTRGPGRTYAQLLTAMLVNSEEEATEELSAAIRKWGLDVPKTLTAWGAPNTDINLRTSTASELAGLLQGLYDGNLASPQAREIILPLMAEYTPNDETRLGKLAEFLPGWQLYNKRGTVVEGLLVVGDAAILIPPQGEDGKSYVLVIMGYPGEVPTNDLLMVNTIESIAEAFALYLQANNTP